MQGTANPKRWKYLPHFEGEGIAHLWDLWDLQCQDNFTWYLGSLTCFESTADVYSYNLQLCDWFQVSYLSRVDPNTAPAYHVRRSSWLADSGF